MVGNTHTPSQHALRVLSPESRDEGQQQQQQEDEQEEVDTQEEA